MLKVFTDGTCALRFIAVGTDDKDNTVAEVFMTMSNLNELGGLITDQIQKAKSAKPSTVN